MNWEKEKFSLPVIGKEKWKVLYSSFDMENESFDEEKLNILVNACIKFTMLNVSKNKIVNFNLKNATSFTGESGMYICCFRPSS